MLIVGERSFDENVLGNEGAIAYYERSSEIIHYCFPNGLDEECEPAESELVAPVDDSTNEENSDGGEEAVEGEEAIIEVTPIYTGTWQDIEVPTKKIYLTYYLDDLHLTVFESVEDPDDQFSSSLHLVSDHKMEKDDLFS